MNINVKNSNPAELTIEIEGVIGMDEEWQFADSPSDARISTYEKFRTIVDQITRDNIRKVRINIRSTGGSVQDALLIHSALMTLPKDIAIETHCYGFSASAATIIAQAAGEGNRYVASSALYLIHNASTQFEGNASEAQSAASLLNKTDEQIAAIYAERSGLDSQHFAQIMALNNGNGEWLTAEEAVQAGLADHIEKYSTIKNLVNQVRDLWSKLLDTKQAQEVEQPAEALKILDATPTTTAAKDDPIIEHYAMNLTKNQTAYELDAQIFQQA